MHPALLQPEPGRIKGHIWRDGRQYFSMPELARRRACSRQAADRWAKRHPDKCVKVGKHTYARDEK